MNIFRFKLHCTLPTKWKNNISFFQSPCSRRTRLLYFPLTIKNIDALADILRCDRAQPSCPGSILQCEWKGWGEKWQNCSRRGPYIIQRAASRWSVKTENGDIGPWIFLGVFGLGLAGKCWNGWTNIHSLRMTLDYFPLLAVLDFFCHFFRGTEARQHNAKHCLQRS